MQFLRSSLCLLMVTLMISSGNVLCKDKARKPVPKEIGVMPITITTSDIVSVNSSSAEMASAAVNKIEKTYSVICFAKSLFTKSTPKK